MPKSTTGTTPHNNAKFYPIQLTGIPISLSVAKAALGNIRGIKRLLRKEESWIKGEYENNTGPQPTYCLIGAKRAVDGKGEDLADTILQQCASGEKVVKDGLLTEEFKNRFVDLEEAEMDQYFDPCILEQKTGIVVFDDDDNFSAVQEFNDDYYTTFADIHRFLDHCIKQSEKLVVRLTKARDKAKSQKATKTVGKKK